MQQINVLVVATPPHRVDVRGESLKHTLQEDLHLAVEQVRTASLYTIQSPRTAADLEVVRQALFTDAIVQESYWAKRPPVDCQWVVQVGFLPGLADNVGRTSAEALADIYDDREPV